MDFNLKEKHALVCGGSKGIGGAIAISLAMEGARVTIVARNESELQEHMKRLPGNGHSYLKADLLERKDLLKVLEYIEQHPVEIIINNTGGPAPGPITEAKIENFQSALNMHLFASHQIMQTALPHMKSIGYGRFINVISTSVRIPISGLGVSNTTRGAMASWAKTLSNEVAPFGITVNNILPGAVSTTRLDAIIESAATKKGISVDEAADAMRLTIPAGRFGRPEELGDLACFLASEKASYITGVSIPVDGGRTGSL
ncbi:MAG: short-chain dehydrogenase [Flammeovirgaceae bacterium]|nr:short-chain dehydrogenase [Flammeovirgaceae bacterium]MBE61292.1 short-chain dehydrogenase [Flammeovirgaceae bacterium]MBR06314.1 short-chain dehydrogenase [Rickettsiales bacterium]HCX24853.1 short-chain dehydrogenase [Cytophagales bacterium]|tara:strand:- start:3021 stop:3794 length:774 start_codon:yes stop_codon:yes gene_type:complete